MSRVGFRVDELVARRDASDGTIGIDGWQPGPAGVAALELLGGEATLLVDVAEPDLLVSLRLGDPGAPGVARVVDALLGVGVMELLSHLPDAEPTVVWRKADRRIPYVQGQGGLGLIGRLAIGLAEVSSVGRSDAAIAVGLVEAGFAAMLLAGEITPSPTGLALVRVGVDRWTQLPSDAFDRVGDAALARLVAEGERWSAAVADRHALLSASLRRLLTPLQGRSSGPVASAGGAVSPAAPAAARLRAAPKKAEQAEQAVDVALDLSMDASRAMAAPLADAVFAVPTGRRHDVAVLVDAALSASSEIRVIAAERDGHHLTVHIGGADHAGALWLRVLEGRRPAGHGWPTLLALAPFSGSDRPWRSAVALIPPAIGAPEPLLVDVTANPPAPWCSSPTRATAHATALGALASRAGRQRRVDTPARWAACAQAWESIGDDRRRALAEGYVNGASAAPLLIDEL